MDLEDWYWDSVKYLKAIYEKASSSSLCNTAVALSRMSPGTWMTLGLALDGTPAEEPRDGVAGLDLANDWGPTSGEPVPDEVLRTVYMGIAPSQLPWILSQGVRGSAGGRHSPHAEIPA